MGRRRAGYLTREYRRAKRAMTPNRVAARFISGGKHQTFTLILTSPFKAKTVTSGKNRRKQYQARVRKERAAASRQARRDRAAAAKRRRDDAAYAKSVQAAVKARAPRKPHPGRTPIAVDPRTGKPITWAQAMKSLKEAQDRAERLAAGLPGDAPARAGGSAKGGSRQPPSRQPPSRKPAPRKKAAKKNAPPPPPPMTQGKNLRGLYYAATCPCQGTGRIYTYAKGQVAGSVSCPEHGRAARGGRRIFSRRAMTDSGLPGVAGWLAAKYKHPRGNLDRKQERATRQAGRARYAGPTAECGTCRGIGTVNRVLTAGLRDDFIGSLIEKLERDGERIPSNRKLEAMASRAYPYDLCRACKGLGRVPDPHAGPWFEGTRLRETHRPTAREAATGRRIPNR